MNGRWGVLAFALSLSVSGVGAAAAAQGISNFQISGNEVTATVSLAGGVGADLSLVFEQAVGLSSSSLGLSAALTSATALVGRLPSGVSLPSAFPVVVKIDPPSSGSLSFSGIATLSLHTENLTFVTNSPLRLLRAQSGGSFVDITEAMGAGSYRVRGSTGGFSEFMIGVDTRAIDSVIASKFSALQQQLDAATEIPNAVAEELQEELDASYAAYRAASYSTASDEIDDFDGIVSDHSGSEIPNVWRSSRDLVNVAGEMRAAAASLRFSLDLRAGAGPL